MALSTALLSGPAWAANTTLQGTFGADDAAQPFNVTVDTAGTVDIRSYGYAGGTTATGAVVPRGGFDTILTLFSASGSFINENDDGAGVATDATTGLAGDARITADLTAGTYILTLTQYDNFSIGDLSAGFVETGHPNFTADPNFAVGGACPGNMFRDISGTDGRCRTGNWAVSFDNVASVTPIAAVPEPSALLFAGLGLAALLLMRIYRHQRRTKLLVGGAVVAIASASSALAQNPDFSNTADILHGNRTMLNITDLQVVNVSGNGLNFSQLLTSNSSVTKTASFPASLPGDIYNPYGVKSFSGVMFNQPQAVTVTEVGATHTASNSYLVTTNIRNAGPWFSGISDYAADFFTAGAMADFNNDGFDDFAFTFNDGSIRIATAADVNNPWAGTSGPFKLGPASTVDVLTDMVAGDFKGDGQHEIAGLAFTQVDGIKLVIYTVDPTSLAISPASSFVFSTPLGFKIQYASIARGRFNTTTHDQLAVTFSSAAGPSIVQIIDFTPNTLTPNGGPQLTASTVSIPAGYLQVKTGKFGLGAAASNPYDQVVFHMSSESGGGRFFEILSVNPTDLTLTAHSGITYDQFPCASGIQVGNFDHQQTNQHDLDSQIALMYCSADATTSTMNIYSVDPQTFDVQNPPDSGTPLPIGLGSGVPSFVATDLQGRSMVLGDPTKITINSTKPTIILAAPPMHVDYITPVGGNAPVVLNISAMPSGFNSSFALSQDSKTSGTTTSKLSWSAGLDASVSGAFQVGDPDDGTGSRFSAGFHFASDFTGSSDNSTVNFSGSSYQIKNAAKTGDIVFFNDSRQNIWVYPVIGQTACPADCSAGQKPLTVQFSGPDEVETGQTPASDFGAFWYQPPWEWGNVLSYPATKDQLALIYPGITDQTTFSNSVSFKPTTNSTSIEANWSAGQTQATSSSLANTTSFDVTTSYVSSWGLSKIAKGKLSASLKLSGSIGFAKLQENTAEVDASNGVSILSTAVFPDTSNYGYNVTPYILGNPPPVGVGDSQDPPKADIQTIGPLKTAFTANPTDTLNGGSWWSRTYAYASAPDIALNHPSRWVLSKPALTDNLPSNCGNTGQGQSDVDCFDIAPYYDASGNPGDPWTSNFLSMRGFFITSKDSPGAGPQLGFANAGDQLDLAVRVYNYSLAPVVDGNQVHVRFYAMPIDGNGNSLGDSTLIDEEVVDEVPPFNADADDLNWRIIHSKTPFDTTLQEGKFFAFWVVVWMEDGNGNLVPEIKGHGLTSIPGALTKPSDVPLEMAIAMDGRTKVSYSNNVGFYHYAFPVLPAVNGEPEITAPENPAALTMKIVYAAKKRVRLGESDEITAVFRTELNPPKRVKVHFYDGDPDAGGQPIETEIAWFQPRSTTKVRIPYHPPKDGVQQIWAVVNRGTPNQIVRHTAAILVGKATADRSKSDGM